MSTACVKDVVFTGALAIIFWLKEQRCRRERERDRQTETGRQTDRQTDRQTHRQTDTQRDGVFFLH